MFAPMHRVALVAKVSLADVAHLHSTVRCHTALPTVLLLATVAACHFATISTERLPTLVTTGDFAAVTAKRQMTLCTGANGDTGVV